MNEPVDSPPKLKPTKPWLELASAILLGAASLATAWCSYQNSGWSGQSRGLAARADKLERQALAWHIDGQQIETVQTRIFMRAIEAQLEGNEKVAVFYIDRFSAELKPAYEKWLALKPFDNPACPPHPFIPSLYTPRFTPEINDARADAVTSAAKSSAASENASGYLGNTVILATVLFFAGTAGKFHQRRVRYGSLAFAMSMFTYAAVKILTLPVI